MSKLLADNWFVVVLLALGLGVLGASLSLVTRSKPGEKPSLLEYLLVLPLILRRQKELYPRRGDRQLTTRELIGWGILLVLIILGVVFSP